MEPKIKAMVAAIRRDYDVMFVIGIGGSYAGSKAAIELLPTDFPVVFIGHGYEANDMDRLWAQYQDQRIKLCIISKSGQTFEVVAALQYMEAKFRAKYGKDFTRHMIAITGAEGKLRTYAEQHQIETILHPDVGGRYSVLTIVGLFPMAVAGIDTDALLKGANFNKSQEQHLIKQYAEARYAAYQDGKRVEVMAVSMAAAQQFADWYQQLFGESEGKDHKGMWTSVLVYSRDLHSMGQFIQQGTPIICETIINIKDPGNQLDKMNQICVTAVAKAHQAAGVPVIKFDLERTAYDLGRLFNLFLEACVLYCNHLGVNAFNQPGVETYKKEMRNLLNEKNN